MPHGSSLTFAEISSQPHQPQTWRSRGLGPDRPRHLTRSVVPHRRDAAAGTTKDGQR